MQARKEEEEARSRAPVKSREEQEREEAERARRKAAADKLRRGLGGGGGGGGLDFGKAAHTSILKCWYLRTMWFYIHNPLLAKIDTDLKSIHV